MTGVLLRSPQAREVLSSGRLGHLTTLNRDGSPHTTGVWVTLADDEVVFVAKTVRQKVRNIEHDPRVSLSIETDVLQDSGLLEHLVISGQARVTDEPHLPLLRQLAAAYLGPDRAFAPLVDPSPRVVVRIVADRISGVGPWA